MWFSLVFNTELAQTRSNPTSKTSLNWFIIIRRSIKIISQNVLKKLYQPLRLFCRYIPIVNRCFTKELIVIKPSSFTYKNFVREFIIPSQGISLLTIVDIIAHDNLLNSRNQALHATGSYQFQDHSWHSQ